MKRCLIRPPGSFGSAPFTGLAHRLLRRHWNEAALRQDFQILDSGDQLRLIKRLLADERVDEQMIAPPSLQYFISGAKEAGLRPDQARSGSAPYGEEKKQLYALYQKRCETYGLVDFGELLLRAAELWQNNPELLAGYRERFRWLLVDEFQDTNGIQYSWLKQLCGTTGVPFAVGDDDQSIYRWRGAQVENLRRYTRDFKDVRTVRLERNYRSTATILKAANAVIAHNASRFSKKLWTKGEKGRAGAPFCCLQRMGRSQPCGIASPVAGRRFIARPGCSVSFQRAIPGV